MSDEDPICELCNHPASTHQTYCTGRDSDVGFCGCHDDPTIAALRSRLAAETQRADDAVELLRKIDEFRCPAPVMPDRNYEFEKFVRDKVREFFSAAPSAQQPGENPATC